MGLFDAIFGSKAIQDNILVDMHSHILPGIDDGAQNTDESICLIQHLFDHGKKKLIMTPHIMGGVYNNTPESVSAVLENLKIEKIKKFRVM